MGSFTAHREFPADGRWIRIRWGRKIDGQGGRTLNIPTCVSALLAAALLAACDGPGEVSDAEFEGHWVFVSGTTVRLCQKLTTSDGGGLVDAGVTTDMLLLSGTETFVAEDGGPLYLIDGAFGFPSSCRMAVTRDGGTAVAEGGCHFGDGEGYGASSVMPQTFEISDDRSSLSFMGSYSYGTHDTNFRWFSSCTYSTTGTLRRP
jgi:hypothetical protein